ncbi:hypothetical protein Acsp06_24600 [Actinomycetospora sp. NBRC 106375]|uniref:DUF3224 domain-containing protein n=1 Tax=Actinomycetospora sp. NBRC 106375 TaxID=3032207 RepID=UPI0024A1B9D6|nr:DUF3224 domain-containing protein [Actinomycetospora sp. NBRC 106375]GLZ46275.1 hypothetical protein Acsp06_24600 [Actinomycetospora sp. NBRC 106375]
MTTHLESAFTIDVWEPAEGDALAEPEGRGPATGRALVRKTYTGPLAGTSVAELLTTQGEGGAAYLAQERVVGELEGRAGSFVLQHGAAGGDGQELRQWAYVVAGSGTGGLAGLQGTGILAHELLTLDYELP